MKDLKNTSYKYEDAVNYYDGSFYPGNGKTLEVESPVSSSIISNVILSNKDDLDRAVNSAKKAFEKWSNTTIKQRVQVLFKYKALLEENIDELSNLIVEENGKIYSEAKAEIDKAIEVIEFACSLPQIAPGEILEVSNGVDCRSVREPLGVVASITPFNFPSMVPHWTIPNILALGNAMILKPSEQVPLSSIKIAKLLKEAGLPDGVFNIVQGDKEIVEAICDHEDIKAVSFVGSTKIAKIVYQRASHNLKRVIALGGAKNHLVLLPDANPEMAASNILASMSGCAGQRCMAASVLVAVEGSDHIIDRMIELSSKIIPCDNLGAVISKSSKDRINNYIDEAEKQGAKVIVDGRNPKVDSGYYVGPTLIDNVTPNMKISKEEVFGPVLSIIRVNNIDEAVEIVNSSEYGNGAGVFTQSGNLARDISMKLQAGMIGINIGVPVPREPFAFGGIKDSKFGVSDITGKSSIEFWTQTRKITTKWNPEAQVNWMS